MSKYLIVAFSFLLVGCKCAQKENTIQDISDSIVSEKLEGFLPQATFETLNTINQISYFKVNSSLIEGTDNEYSNKSLFVRDLSDTELKELLHYMKNDDSYQWENYTKETNFEVANQLICKSDQGQFNLLTNKDHTIVSFISLEGQSIIPINQDLTIFLKTIN